jgi:hypothetical protein
MSRSLIVIAAAAAALAITVTAAASVRGLGAAAQSGLANKMTAPHFTARAVALAHAFPASQTALARVLASAAISWLRL